MRLQISISDKLYKEITDYSEMLGTPVSTTCAVLLGQSLSQYKMAEDLVKTHAPELLSKMSKRNASV